MGLAIATHFLVDTLENDAEGAQWFRDKLVIVNGFLTEAGLPPHVEPEVRGTVRTRRHCGGFPYSFLHYLRRAFAYVREGQPLTPVVKNDDPASDPVVEDAATMMDTHLLCHSDAEGYYVPVDFSEVIFDTEERGLPGGMLGSTQRLMAELVEVAPAIGIELVDGTLPDTVGARLAEEGDGAHPYWIERLVWLALHEHARVSLANKTMIVFC